MEIYSNVNLGISILDFKENQVQLKNQLIIIKIHFKVITNVQPIPKRYIFGDSAYPPMQVTNTERTNGIPSKRILQAKDFQI